MICTSIQTMSNLCCKCGIAMYPNPANMCKTCLCSEIDITEGLIKHVTIIKCPECSKYLQPPKTWVYAPPGSPDLLTLFIKRLNLDKAKVTLANAECIWKESHSKRIKIQLTIEKEVYKTVLMRSYYVEYVVQDHKCDSCTGFLASPDQCVANVQVRQRVSHRKTIFYLEQCILKNDAASKAIKMKQKKEGVDFLFSKISHAATFVEFVGGVVPIKSVDAKKHVSRDTKSNLDDNENTFSVDIAPICCDDLVFLPPKKSGGLGPLVICTKITSQIVLLDPITLMFCSLNADQYWDLKFESLLSSKSLVEYIVLYVYDVSPQFQIHGLRYALAYAEVARVSDFGRNDTRFTVRTHLGHILREGDYALGYDLKGAIFSNLELDEIGDFEFPDVILIKKSYEQKRAKKSGKIRPWKLKSLKMEVEGDLDEKANDEYEQFCRDLEENPDLRFRISLYHNKDYVPSENESMTGEEDVPFVRLHEMLADLDLNKESEDGDKKADHMEEC